MEGAQGKDLNLQVGCWQASLLLAALGFLERQERSAKGPAGVFSEALT